MEIEIITKQDLEAFAERLLHDIKELLSQKKIDSQTPYLRSREARKLLGGISSGTLQSLRVKGILKPTKIEGVFYYKVSEINALLNGNNA